MKINKIVSVLSIAVITGSIVGVVNSIYYIIANRYIQYKMFRLVAFSFEKYLSKWIILLIIISFAGIIILRLLLLLAKPIGKLLISNIIDIHVKDKNKLRVLLLSGIVCSIFFFYGGWFINHYWLPYKFHPISLLGDLGILIFTIFLGLILIKVKWETLCKLIKPDRRIVIALVVFLFIFKLCIVIDSKINIPEGPNVILLIVDAWRADSLGCYNKNSSNTPNIDKFAENAVLFENFIAQSPCTINSAPSMFCSVYPYEHGYFNYNCIVPYRLNTLAELLRNKGYQTFGISTNIHVTHRNGLGQGFNVFIEDSVWKETDCDEVNDRFIGWLNKGKHKQFFAMMWYSDPHCPYDPPPEFRDKYILEEDKSLVSDKTKIIKHSCHFTPEEKGVTKKLYAGEVNFFDAKFAKLVDYLKKSGLMKNSIIILTSDHGESFWEKKDPLGVQVKGHGNSLYEEQIKIPFIISLPNQQGGKVVLERAQHIDIVPTVLEYAEIDSKVAGKLYLRGNSLKGVISGKELKREYFFSQLITDQYGPFYMECNQTGSFKLISTQQYEDVHFTPSYLLFLDLNSGESEIDVTDEISRPEFAELKRQLLSWEGSLEKVKLATKQIKRRSNKEEEKLMERLKSLGYLR